MSEMIEDGFGNAWQKCGPGCHLEFVRPGKVQCLCDYDPSSPHEEGLPDCPYCAFDDEMTEEEIDAAMQLIEESEILTMPPVNEYGHCVSCGRRRGTGCACGMTFAEKIKTVHLDEEALRIFNIGGKGRKRGKDHADNKRNA